MWSYFPRAAAYMYMHASDRSFYMTTEYHKLIDGYFAI